MTFPTFEPLIPSSLWLGLAVAGAAMLVWYALRRPAVIESGRWWRTVALMAAGLLVVLAVLLNPTWVEKVPPPAGKPTLTVLVDASASMGTADAAGGRPRYADAARIARRAADRLSDKFDVRIETFGDTVATTDLAALDAKTPSSPTTDLGGGLAGALDQDRPAGQAVLLLSDGIHNAGGGSARVMQAVRTAKALAAPVYTRTTGGQKLQWDVAVELRAPQDLAFVKQSVPLTVRVRSTATGIVKTELLLLRDGKEVARRDVQVAPNGSSDVHFAVTQEKPGLYPYEVRATALPGEVSQANNSASYLLRVVDEPIRVLVLEGKPYWDSKFLVRTLAADPAVALDVVVKMAEGRLIRRTVSKGADAAAATQPAPAPAPANAAANAAANTAAAESRSETWKVMTDASELLGNAERLRGYQIIVLGRDSEVFLTESAVGILQSWVSQDGGSLVCYRGAPAAQLSQRLARMFPVKWTAAREARIRVKLTDQGREAQWAGAGDAAEGAMARLPTLATAAQVDSNKALAVTLATAVGPDGREMPAVAYQPYGAGRVVAIEGAGMWRWAFLPPAAQGGEQDEVYGQLWHGLLRWLTSGAQLLPGQKMTLRTDKVTFNTVEPATVTLLTREEGGGATLPRVELVNEATPGEKQSASPVPVGDDPGTFRVTFGKLPEGRYRARVGGAAAENSALSTAFDVKLLGEEQLDLAARPDLMKRIADDSGGAVLAGDEADVDEIARRFEEYMEKTRPAAVRRTTAWDRWWVLLAIVGLWSVTWAVRRSGGLV